VSDALVIDASVTIQLFVEEALSPRAWQLFRRLAEPEPVMLFAPDLMYIECANILWKYSERFGYDAGLAQENLEDLAELEIETVPTHELFVKAYRLAQQLGITAYDACYVALAQELGCPLITADQRLTDRISKEIASIQWLGDHQSH
jgi:predicted nucleic acid-binding protein